MLDTFSRAPTAIERIDVRSGRASLATYVIKPINSTLAPLLFLHAGVCDSRMWSDQFAQFGAARRCIAFDRRGFGATAPVDEHWIEIDDIRAVMDACAVNRALLVGCSNGGRIAVDFALAEPQCVAGLVLVAAGIGGMPWDGSDDPRLAAFNAAFEKAEAAGDVDAQISLEAHYWLDGPFAREGRVAGEPRERLLSMNRIAKRAPRLGSTDRPTTAYADLARVMAPTLVIWGTLDEPDVITMAKHAAETIPHARRCELADVAHLPSLEAPARFDESLSSFLRDSGLD